MEMLQYLQNQNQATSPMITNDSMRKQQPMNTIQVGSTGEYLTPQGTRQEAPAQFQSARRIDLDGMPALVDAQGNIEVDTPSGKAYTTMAQVERNAAEQRMRKQIANIPRQKQMADIEKTQAETMKLRGEAAGGVKPTFSAEMGGYVYPPSQEIPQGRFVPVEGTKKQDKSTEGERKAATLLLRLGGSQQQLESALKQEPSAAKPGIVASGLRGIGMEALANTVAVGPQRQQIEAAQLDILDAALTLGTGAAYTKEQLEGYRKSYFPQIGDKPATIADKKARLDNVIQAAKIAAGGQAERVAQEFAGRPTQSSSGQFEADKEARYQAWKASQGR